MAAVEQLRDRCVGEPEGVIQLAVSQQTAVGGDPGAVEFKSDDIRFKAWMSRP
jgi:hypothetical protein